MILVLALLITTLCGVQSASIPSKSLDTIARKSGKLEKPLNLEKIRRDVLDDMKKLLDSQLAALFESAVTRKAGTQRKRLPKTKSSFSTEDAPPKSTFQEPKSSEDPQNSKKIINSEKTQNSEEPENSELIKVLTDDSLQDPEDEVLRAAVDQLLQDDENKTAANVSSGNFYNDDDQIDEDDSSKINSEDNFDDNIFDDAIMSTLGTNDKNIPKSNVKKGKSHVAIKHLPKTNTNDDGIKKTEKDLDLDEILKTALNGFSDSLSDEDEKNKSINGEDRDLETLDFYPGVSQSKESRMSNYSQTGLRIHDRDNNSFEVDGMDNVNVDENALNIETHQVNNVTGVLETDSNSTNKQVNSKSMHHKHVHHHRKNVKGHQPMNYESSNENNTNNDINSTEKELHKYDNEDKNLKVGNNKDKPERKHVERKHLQRKSKKRFNNRNKKNHSKDRQNGNHGQEKLHNDNKSHDYVAKANHHIIVKLISDSDGSHEARLDTISDRKPLPEKKISSSSSFKKGRQHSFEETDRIDLPNDLQDDDTDTSNNGERSYSNSNENNKYASERDSVTKEYESGSEEEDLAEKRNVKVSNESVDTKPVSKDKEKKTSEKIKSNYKHGIDKEDASFEKEGIVTENEYDVTKEIKDDIRDKTKVSKETDDTDFITKKKEEEFANKGTKTSEKDGTYKCPHETEEANIIHDLLHNKDMKKSYSLSLTLSTK